MWTQVSLAPRRMFFQTKSWFVRPRSPRLTPCLQSKWLWHSLALCLWSYPFPSWGLSNPICSVRLLGILDEIADEDIWLFSGVGSVILGFITLFNQWLSLFFFNWRIIALQYCFCHTSTWINHMNTYVLSLLNLLPTSYSFSTLFDCSQKTTSIPGEGGFIYRPDLHK